MRNNGHFGFRQRLFSSPIYKLGCVVRMVVDSILPHAESGPNDHRKDAPPFRKTAILRMSIPVKQIIKSDKGFTINNSNAIVLK